MNNDKIPAAAYRRFVLVPKIKKLLRRLIFVSACAASFAVHGAVLGTFVALVLTFSYRLEEESFPSPFTIAFFVVAVISRIVAVQLGWTT